ncbi:YHYH domain-containing protein [Paenibacillus elgii]|uniref:YHYH domain-containing protein n=1 Tax=Paenibacillus elgii TaxID=189691 RepID=A0A2T6G4D2_9BACL|nr:YHYH domain-containing protein [Paenibacillus elgii]PUA39016.1 YHYH domain-containing protein [Paenibacillus elgii]
MKLKQAVLGIALFSLSFSSIASIASAHPGRTDKNGGHTCRTNCAKWGLEDGEYHYHNGGSTSSGDSGSKSSSPKATPSSPAKEEVPDGMIKVNVPAFKVYVNNLEVSNASAQYPVITYKDITYFPMTWSYTQALGLETKWDKETGFVIRKTANKAAKLNADLGTPPAKLYAKLPDFNVFVNDAWFDNSTEAYPLLVLNDVTYFPMTWKLAVEDLGLTTKFENNAFYISK